MKRWLLTLPLLLAGMVGVLRADFVVVVVNVGPAKPPPADPNAKANIDPDDLIAVVIESDPVAKAEWTVQQVNNFGNKVEPTMPTAYNTAPLPVVIKGRGYQVARWSGVHLAKVWTEDVPGGKAGQFTIPASLKHQFDLKRGKPGESQAKLAEWALTHGMVGRYVELMEKLQKEAGEKDPETKAALDAFKTANEILGQPAIQPPNEWINRYTKLAWKNRSSPHYTIVHNYDEVKDKRDKATLDAREAMLEDAVKTFFYLNVIHGNKAIAPLKERLVVILHAEADAYSRDVEQCGATLPGKFGAAQVGDGFFSPREGVLFLRPFYDEKVWSEDPRIKRLKEMAERECKSRLMKSFDDILSIYLSAPANPGPLQAAVPAAVHPATLVAVYRWLEADTLRYTITHNATRQLIYATQQLPRYVIAPEWIQYGMASNFETTAGAPWATPTGINPVHLSVFKEQKYESKPVDTLKMVVTDGYFRKAAHQSDDAVASAATLAKARAASWWLTYYLAMNEPEKLRKYHDELKKLPRDLDFDEDTLIGCFARACGAVDKNGKPDPSRLEDWARKWVDAAKEQKDDAAALHALARDTERALKNAPLVP
jgi:hypothetical protein